LIREDRCSRLQLTTCWPGLVTLSQWKIVSKRSMRAYWIAIAALAGLTLLMAGQDVGLSVLLVTLGLGFPFVFAATGLVYGLCAAPLVVFWPAGGRARQGGAAAALVLIALVALAPCYIGRYAAAAAAAVLRASDHMPKEQVGASTLEIRRPADSYDGTFADQQACGVECRTLLSTGQARWLRVVEVKQFTAQTVTSSTFHQALRGKACAAPGADPNDSAVCVVDVADPGDPANLVIDFVNPLGNREAIPLTPFASIVRRRAVVVRTGPIGQGSEIMRQTEITVETPIRPAVFGPGIQFGHSGGVDVVRDDDTINPLTLGGVLRRLGYSLHSTGGAPSRLTEAQFQTPVDESMTREMIAVLDLPGDAPFNDQQMAVLFSWIQHARHVKEWTPDLLAVLRRFVRDRRVRRPTFFAQIFTRPEVAAALLPDVLDMIEIDGIGKDYTPAREAAYRLGDIDAALLVSQASRIVALLDKGPDVRAILLPIVGRISVDPLPYLTPILADRTSPSPYSFYPRVIGACRADPQWTKELISPLRDAYRDTSGRLGNDQYYRGLVLKALANLGDRDFVEHELSTSDKINAKQLRIAIDSALSGKDPSRWLCQWM
jgi:hypothetical protein